MSYLSDVKCQLEEVFFDAFGRAWKETVEPAVKQSYKNGVEAGRAERSEEEPADDAKPLRRQWGKRARSTSEQEAGACLATTST